MLIIIFRSGAKGTQFSLGKRLRPKCRCDRHCCRLALGSEDVAVDVGCHPDRGVAQYVGDHLQGNVLSEHDAGSRVSQLMRVPSA